VKSRVRRSTKVVKLFCACPHCEATDSISVTDYVVRVAKAQLVLVFDPSDKQQTIVPVFDRQSGEAVRTVCYCVLCKSEMTLSTVLEHNERKRCEGG